MSIFSSRSRGAVSRAGDTDGDGGSSASVEAYFDAVLQMQEVSCADDAEGDGEFNRNGRRVSIVERKVEACVAFVLQMQGFPRAGDAEGDGEFNQKWKRVLIL